MVPSINQFSLLQSTAGRRPPPRCATKQDLPLSSSSHCQQPSFGHQSIWPGGVLHYVCQYAVSIREPVYCHFSLQHLWIIRYLGPLPNDPVSDLSLRDTPSMDLSTGPLFPMEFGVKRSSLPKNKLAVIVETEEGTLYCCVECPAKFQDKEKLEVHLCSHFEEYRFLCGICGTGLKRKEHLDRHTLGHQEVRPHVCPECGKGFKRKEHLTIHRSIHSGDKTQVCELCHRSFYRKDHLQKHLQTHTKMFMEHNMFALSDQEMMDVKQEVLEDEDVKPAILDDNGCEVVMRVGENGRSPYVNGRAPKDPQRPFECRVCEKTYKRKDHLKLHSLTHVEKDKICSECGKAFHKEEQLLVHMSVHLSAFSRDERGDHVRTLIDNSDISDIDIVPIESAELLVPRAHYSPPSPSPHSPPSPPRPHGCEQCGRRFKRRQHLKVHSNVHLKQQHAKSQLATIWCSLCNEGFHNNSQFEEHQCLQQPQEDEEEYEEQAGAPQDAKKENNHPAPFTPIPIVSVGRPPSLPSPPAPAPLRVYVCKFCQKPFRRKDHYKIHLHIHTGVKSFFCPDCAKGFYRKDHLQKHIQVHQKQKVAQQKTEPKPKKSLPELFPINLLRHSAPGKDGVKPEITITAKSNTKLRVPLKIKVPYQMVITSDDGEQSSIIQPNTTT